METPLRSRHLICFGAFEFDPHTGELRKHGMKLKLQGHAIDALVLLLEHPGELVTREELQKRLWSADTFVDFEHSLNAAVKRLREVLDDSADRPCFIETLPRHGYRFIAPLNDSLNADSTTQQTGEKSSSLHSEPSAVGGNGTAGSGASEGTIPPEDKELSSDQPRRGRARPYKIGVLVVVLLVGFAAVVIALNGWGLRDRLLSVVGGRRTVISTPKIESIAVLPLENLSGDKEQEYFADGMTEALITDLGKISALRVISRTSVMQYKGTKKPLPQIARELNVDAIVEGTVQRSDNRVRITANLLHASGDRHIWADAYERDLLDVLALQDEVARAIASEIQIKVTPNEQVHLASARPVNPEAYEAYIKGRTSLETWTVAGVKTSIKHFEKAIAVDPTYAEAYTGLADAYSMEGDLMVLLPKEAYPRAKEIAAKALALDGNLAEAYASLCHIRVRFDWDWPAAEIDCMRAVELNPNSVSALNEASRYHLAMGRTEEGLALAKRWVERDPLSPAAHSRLGGCYYYSRRYDDAIVEFENALTLDPNYPNAWEGLGHTYLEKRMYPEAIKAYDRSAAVGSRAYSANLGNAYARAGMREQALKVLEEMKRISKHQHVPPGAFAWIYTGLGDKDQAFLWLGKAFEERDTSGFPMAKVFPAWDPLRSDPRYQDLLRRMNFPP